MKSLAIMGFLTGIIFVWMVFIYEPQQAEVQRAEAYARSFVRYRNAVHSYAYGHKQEGSISINSLSLPSGYKTLGVWENRIVLANNTLCCYVYGKATTDEVQAVISVSGSPAIGWNNRGFLQRSGPPVPLPAFIPNGYLVSVVALD